MDVSQINDEIEMDEDDRYYDDDEEQELDDDNSECICFVCISCGSAQEYDEGSGCDTCLGYLEPMFL